MTCSANFLHKINHPVLKGLCKFQVDIPINARVMAAQSLEKIHTFILQQPCSMMGKRMPTSPFSHIIVIRKISNFFAPYLFFCWSKELQIYYRDPLHGPIRHIKIWGKLIIICTIMFLMTSCANHQLITQNFNSTKNGWIKCSFLKFSQLRDVFHRIKVPYLFHFETL